MEENAAKVKLCPACGKNCVPRNGKHGEFLGCPDFPKCPGKAASMSAAQRKSAGQKLRQCYNFINRMGSTKEAEKWLKLAIEVVMTTKGT